MDILKVQAAIAFLCKNIDQAPENVRRSIEKLIVINNEARNIVKSIGDMKSRIEEMDSELGQKIGGAKVLFEIAGEQLSDEDIDKFAPLFELKKPTPVSENSTIDIAGITAKDLK